MKLFLAIVLILGGINLFLYFKKNPNEEDLIFAKSEKIADKKAIRDLKELDDLGKKVDKHELKGKTNTRDHTKYEQLSERLHNTSGFGGSSGGSSNNFSSSAGSSSTPLKRF